MLQLKHRVVERKQKQDPYNCCRLYIHATRRDTHRLKVRAWNKIFHANRNKKSCSSNSRIK